MHGGGKRGVAVMAYGPPVDTFATFQISKIFKIFKFLSSKSRVIRDYNKKSLSQNYKQKIHKILVDSPFQWQLCHFELFQQK